MLAKLSTSVLFLAGLVSFAVGEGVHLVNCNRAPGTSWILYYEDDSTASHAGDPTDATQVYSGGYVDWEGHTVSGYFQDTGVTFKANIKNGASNQAVGSYAGTGYNGSPWTCYTDNGHFISNNGIEPCYSEFYCLK